MGFDQQPSKNQCYTDESTNDVGMNVEIIEASTRPSVSTLRHVIVDNAVKGHTRYSMKLHNEKNLGSNSKSKPSKDDTYKVCEEYSEPPELFLLVDDNLVKPGDQFTSLEAFVQYLNENAKRWNYYYVCSKTPTADDESFIYNCIYLNRNKENLKKKGVRKRINTMKTNCPCKIELRRLTSNENKLIVVDVCNYHDHELSAEQFHKLQHGRRLPPYVKEEILDLLALYIDKGKIRNYVEMETGFKMGNSFFYALERNMIKNLSTKREISSERLKMLTRKIAVAEEKYRNQEGQNKDRDDESDTTKAKVRRLEKKKGQANSSEKNRQSVSTNEVALASINESNPEGSITYNEILESVMNLQETVRCETQSNPWVPDQCLTELSNTTDGELSQDNTHSEAQDSEEDMMNVEYLDDSINELTDDITGEVDTIENNEVENNDNTNTDNEEYQTIVVNEEGVINNEMVRYVINDNGVIQRAITGENNDLEDSNVVHLQIQNDEDTSQVQYVTENNERIVVIQEENNDESSGNNIGLQANSKIDTGQTLLPVFDVCMKDGNVMGFVVNNDAINGLKDGVDEAIQTSEDIMYSDILEVENEDSEMIEVTDDTRKIYTKHEYVHRYNLEQYMTKSYFPRYVEILAKETDMDILEMFTSIYNEKGMFKLTTTHKGKEGNTRIRYITHNGKVSKKKVDDAKREKYGRNLQSIFILKEKMRMLKRENRELVKRNQYLQEVACKAVKLGS